MSVDIRERLQIAEPVDNAKVLAALDQVASAAGVAVGCSKEMGVLLFKLVTAPKGKSLPEPHRDMVARRIGSGDILRSQQLDAALSYLTSTSSPDDAELCAQSGVGVVVGDAEVAAAAKALVESEREPILATRYLTNVGVLLRKLASGPGSDRLKWAEGAKLKAALDGAVAELLGPKTAEDLDPKAARAALAARSAAAGAPPAAPAARAKAAPKAEGDAAAAEEASGAERKFRPPAENFGEPPYALNKPELLAAHLKATGGKVVTRFPPEPNGAASRAGARLCSRPRVAPRPLRQSRRSLRSAHPPSPTPPPPAPRRASSAGPAPRPPASRRRPPPARAQATSTSATPRR